MKKTIKDVRFFQEGTLVFGDIYLDDGFVQRIDYKTCQSNADIVIPGFINIQAYGTQTFLNEKFDEPMLRNFALEQLSHGVTTFCPTLANGSLRDFAKAIDGFRKVFRGPYRGAQYAGCRLDGPYLNPEMAGSLDANTFEKIDLIALEAFLHEYHKDIVLMNIAVELEHALEAVQLLKLYGVETSLAHSNASFVQTCAAYQQGLKRVTHLGNDMPKIDQKQPTMIDAIFLHPFICEIVMDRNQMQRQMLKWVIQLLTSKRIIAISDYALNINNKNQNLLDVFRYLYREEEYDLLDCINMCSSNSAELIKMPQTEISLGKKVDILILDHTIKLKSVYVNGTYYSFNS